MTVWAWAVVVATGAAAGATAVHLQHARIIRRHIDAIRHLREDTARLQADIWSLRLWMALSDPEES